MTQYGDQMYRREVLETDEHGNPIRKTEENLVHSATGGRYEHEIRYTDEYGNDPVLSATGGTMSDSVPTQGLSQANKGTRIETDTHGLTGHQGLGTNIGHATGGTGVNYNPSDRSSGGTGLDTERGATTGQHEGLGQANRGSGTGGYGGITTGQQGLGTNIGRATRGTGTNYAPGGHSTDQTGHQGLGTERGSTTEQVNKGTRAGADIGHATGGIGKDHTSDGRSVGQTGYQGLGTEPPGSTEQTGYQGRGTERGSSGAGYGGTSTEDGHEKKGMMEKIKEKLPGHQ